MFYETQGPKVAIDLMDPTMDIIGYICLQIIPIILAYKLIKWIIKKIKEKRERD